jgi:hypothetical protein
MGHFVDLMKFEFYASKCVVFKNFLNLRISSSFLNIFLLNFIFQKFIFKIRWILNLVRSESTEFGQISEKSSEFFNLCKFFRGFILQSSLYNIDNAVLYRTNQTIDEQGRWMLRRGAVVFPLVNDQDLPSYALVPRWHSQRWPPRRRERTTPRGLLLLGAMTARREDAAAVRVEPAAAAPRRLEALPGRLGQVLERPDRRQRRERLRLAVKEHGQAPLEGELRHEGSHLEVRVRAGGRGAGGVVVELRRRSRRVPRRGRRIRVRRRADVLQLLVAHGQHRLRAPAEQEVRLHSSSELQTDRSGLRRKKRQKRKQVGRNRNTPRRNDVVSGQGHGRYIKMGRWTGWGGRSRRIRTRRVRARAEEINEALFIYAEASNATDSVLSSLPCRSGLPLPQSSCTFFPGRVRGWIRPPHQLLEPAWAWTGTLLSGGNQGHTLFPTCDVRFFLLLLPLIYFLLRTEVRLHFEFRLTWPRAWRPHLQPFLSYWRD